jgi:hypothetical protein
MSRPLKHKPRLKLVSEAQKPAPFAVFGKLPHALKPLAYVSGQACVNCGNPDRQFHVGRVSAECAHCGDVVSI